MKSTPIRSRFIPFYPPASRGAKSDTPLQRLYNEARASQKKAQENLDKLKRIVISIK